MQEYHKYSFLIPNQYQNKIETMILSINSLNLEISLFRKIDNNDEFTTYELILSGDLENIENYKIWINMILDSIKMEFYKKAC